MTDCRWFVRSASSLILLFCAAAARSEDWPRWRGPRGDGTWQAPKLPETWPAAGLSDAWRRPVGGGYSGIAVSEGLVYTMDRQTEPEEVERVLCFDAASGNEVWTHAWTVQYGK